MCGLVCAKDYQQIADHCCFPFFIQLDNTCGSFAKRAFSAEKVELGFLAVSISSPPAGILARVRAGAVYRGKYVTKQGEIYIFS